MLLFAAVTYSCSRIDNAVDDPSVVIELDGQTYKTDLVATFQGEVGAEVTLGLGVYDSFDIYGVDFGDGVIVADSVGNENGGVKDDEGKTKEGTTHTRTTEFKGAVAGDGTVKVYGKSDIWYLTISGNLLPTAFDQPKLANVVQISITGAAAEAIELPELPNLTQFSFNNSPVKKVDVSKVPTLTSLTINNMTAAPQLESIDVSKNPELTYLSLQGTANGTGVLASLDLTNNTKLEGVYVQYNKIKEIKLAAAYEKLGTFNASYNELEVIDPAAMPAVKWFDVRFNKIKGDLDIPSDKLTNVYVNNNELTSVKVPNVTKQFYFDNNNMTLATMPALPEGMNTSSKKKQFHYAPQADLEVAPEGAVLDLSAQASAKGMEAEAQATVFAVTAGDAILEADKDYTVADGKITFLADQKDVIVKMTNAGYPDLTLQTKPFDVKGAGAAAEPDAAVYIAEGETYASGKTVTNGGVSLTFGEDGGAEFKEGVADEHVAGYTAYTAGNGTNGNKAGGTFYTIKPSQAGKVEVAVVLNADKKFYVEEDGTALADFNGITVAEKYYGTFTFPVKAGSSYKVYCAGSKLGFYGFKFFK